MRSFFKLVVVPAPRVLTFSTKLSKEKLLGKVSAASSKRWPMTLGKRIKFIGDVYDDGFEVQYINSEHNVPRSKIVSPVQVNAYFQEPDEIRLSIALTRGQSKMLRFLNGFVLFWWVLWTLLTLAFYPGLLKNEGTVFTSLILMPLGVILAPLGIYEMKKVPKRSLDCAEDYLIKFLTD